MHQCIHLSSDPLFVSQVCLEILLLFLELPEVKVSLEMQVSKVSVDCDNISESEK